MTTTMTMKVNKKEIYRTSLVDHKIYHKKDLLRIVKTRQGEIFVDVEQSILGRGAYICYDLKKALILKRKKLLNKVFKKDVSEQIYDQIIEIIKERGWLYGKKE